MKDVMIEVETHLKRHVRYGDRESRCSASGCQVGFGTSARRKCTACHHHFQIRHTIINPYLQQATPSGHDDFVSMNYSGRIGSRLGQPRLQMVPPRRLTSSVSPPPLKRRKVETQDPAQTPATAADRIVVYSWNVNGIEPLIRRPITSFFKPAAKKDSSINASVGLRDVLRKYSWPTMLLLQEVKIKPDDKATQAAVRQAVRSTSNITSDEPSYVIHFCLPSDKHNARGFGRKVYGVCSIIREDFCETFVERVRDVDWDMEGRFLVCETRAVGLHPKLAFINIYAVNGTDAPYKDSTTGEIVGTRHDRKLQVHRLLQAECRDLEARGFAVVLAGDINIARSRLDGFPRLRESPVQHCKNRADFEAKFFSNTHAKEDADESSAVRRNEVRPSPAEPTNSEAGLGMIDSFRHLHPQQKGYTYYPRSQGPAAFGSSCDRVDMILLSHTLRVRLESAGMHESIADRGPSDHVPLYVSLQFPQSLSGDVSKSASAGRDEST